MHIWTIRNAHIDRKECTYGLKGSNYMDKKEVKIFLSTWLSTGLSTFDYFMSENRFKNILNNY